MSSPVIDNTVFSIAPREFQLFRTLVHERTGIWIRDGKQVMLASRLSRRLRYHGLASFADYYEYVRQLPENSEEVRELINCVTTNKTSFFRERHHFDFLVSTVLPEIVSAVQRGGPRKIRVWSACCSSGEEPYSIAIALLEALRKTPTASVTAESRTSCLPASVLSGSWRIEVCASDIDTTVLQTAARGVYRADDLDTVDDAMQKRYLLRGKDDMAGLVKVKPEVGKLIEFKRINLMDAKWPLEGPFDAIFFRNALIYFNQDTQDVFLRKMARYLKPQGYLFLGNSEHIPWLQDVFAPLRQTMYRLRDVKK